MNILKLIEKLRARFILTKKSNRTFIKIENNVYRNKEIKTYLDLYSKLNISLDDIEKYSLLNIRCNRETYGKLEKYIREHFTEARGKGWNPTYIASSFAMDSLAWSPSVDISLPNDVIAIINENDPTFKKFK